MLTDKLRRFRAIAFWEGISFLILIFIAMPLKRVAGIPEAVSIVGWIHGVLFILYCVALLQAKLAYNWSLKKSAIAFLASLIPFATFYLDRSLAKESAKLAS